MKIKTKLLLMAITLLGFSMYAQDSYQLKGVVNDASNTPIPGVNIVVVNTTRGTSTDFDGLFEIEVKTGDVINISYIGYVGQKITITNQRQLNITLSDDAALLDEVVVVGYGTQKRSNISGAVARVGGDEVAAIQAARVDDALAGKLPGVLIQNQSGEPGADPKIQIRAASSLSGDSTPLIVVDGYPISGSLATVNPNDIQSIEVLKDAASAAIYGSRGANGVILVTTKQGKSGKVSVSYNTYLSTSRKYRGDIEMLKTASEWARDLQTDAYDLSEIDPRLLEYRLNAYTNAPDVVSMEDYIFQNGSTVNHDVNISGGNEDIRVFASLGYLSTTGIAQQQGFDRYNARLNVDANIGEKFKAGLTFNGFYGKQNQLPHDLRDLLRAYSISPITHTQASIDFVQQLDQQRQALFNSGFRGFNINRTFDQDYRGIGLDPRSINDLQPGDVVHDWQYGRNQNGIGGTGDAGVASKLNDAERYTRTYFANLNSYLQYDIMQGLNIKTVLGTDMRDVEEYYYQGILGDGQQRSNQTDLDISNVKTSTVLSETTLNYAKVFAEKHDISAVAGFEFQNTYIKGIRSNGTNVPFGLPLNYELFNAADVVTAEIDQTNTRRSVFGRVNYAFDNRYLLSASLRRDGDSRFGANNKFQNFPALSVGWNIHNESFLVNNETLSQLKLRFSTGSLGTTSFLGPYDALSILNSGQTAFGAGFFIPDNVANQDLTWQTNTETNYGLDLGILRNRFTLGVDYYNSDITDMLISQSVSEVLGTPSVLLNRGNISSSGLELSLNANIINKPDFSWSVNANISTVNQKITSLGALDELPRQVYGGPAGRGPEFRNYVGGELGEMWGFAVTGAVETVHIADPSRNIGFGSSEWYVVDQNGDGEITYEGDYVKLGSAIPDFYWGLSSNLNYKDFDFSLQFQGSQGAEVYNIDPLYWKSEFGGRLRSSFDANNDGIADATGKFYEESRNAHGSGIQDASYIALRNLTLGYTINSDLTSQAGISSLRVYLAGTNLLYLFGDNYTSFNPEGVETTNNGYAGPTTYGYQEGASPIVRSFTLGLNVNF